MLRRKINDWITVGGHPLTVFEPWTDLMRDTETDVTRNVIGAVFFAIILTIWIIVYQTNWQNWGEFGQALLVVNVKTESGW
jgi:hypothetical protein